MSNPGFVVSPQTFGKAAAVSPRTPRPEDLVPPRFHPLLTDISNTGCEEIKRRYKLLIVELDELEKDLFEIPDYTGDDLKEIIKSLENAIDAAHEKKEQMDGGGGERIKNAIKSFYNFSRIARGCITINAIRVLLFKLLTIFFNTAYNYALVHFMAAGAGTLGGWAAGAASVSPIGAALGPYLIPVLGSVMVLYGANKIIRIIKQTTRLPPHRIEEVAREVKTEILRRNMQEMIKGAVVADGEDDVAIKLVMAKEIVVQNLMNGEIRIPNTDELNEITKEQIPELPFIERVYSKYMIVLDKLGGLPEDAIMAILNYLKARAAGEGAGGQAYEDLMNELKLATIILSLSGADLGASLSTHTGFTILAGAGNLAQTIATCAGVAAVSRVIGRRITEILTSAQAVTGAAVNNAGVPVKVAEAFVGFLKEDRKAVNKARREGQAQFNQELVDSINRAAENVLAEYTVTGRGPVTSQGEMDTTVEAVETALIDVKEPSGTDEAAVVVKTLAAAVPVKEMVDVEAGPVGGPVGGPYADENVGGGSRRRRRNNKPRKRKTLRKKSKMRKSTKRNSRKTTVRRKSTRRNSRKTNVRRKSKRLSRKSKRLSRKLKK